MNKTTTPETPVAVPVRQRKPFPKKWIWIAAAVVAGGGIAAGSWVRRGRAEIPASNENSAALTVAVAPVKRGPLGNVLTMSAEFIPFQEISVHAKVAGFVQTMSVDIGDHVKEGQVLAVLEIPELDNDVKRVEAVLRTSEEDVHKAEATYEDAHLAYTRLAGVAKSNPKLVAEQDLETAKDKDAEAKSALESSRLHVAESQAEVDKMHAMFDYAKITAPFTGVITKRYADIGSLIQAGISSNTQAMPVVDLAEDDKFRLTFPVPESAVGKVKVGTPITFTVDWTKEVFHGVIARYSERVETATRTMRAEVDVSNQDGKFTQGMYSWVSMDLDARPNAINVPLQALSMGDQPTVMVLNSDQKIEERKVSVGMQTATTAEITSGLQEGELVVVGNRSTLRPGEKAVGKITTL